MKQSQLIFLLELSLQGFRICYRRFTGEIVTDVSRCLIRRVTVSKRGSLLDKYVWFLLILLIRADIGHDIYATMWCHVMKKSNKQEDTQGKSKGRVRICPSVLCNSLEGLTLQGIEYCGSLFPGSSQFLNE